MKANFMSLPSRRRLRPLSRSAFSLVTSRRSRSISSCSGIKVDAALDQWMKEIAPSTELRTWLGDNPARWDEFCRRNRAELHHYAELLSQLRSAARQGPVTLLYSAHDELHNDAIVLRDVILGRRYRMRPTKDEQRLDRQGKLRPSFILSSHV
jgi:uncharacterized protein YeaO (DUF488 family)